MDAENLKGPETKLLATSVSSLERLAQLDPLILEDKYPERFSYYRRTLMTKHRPFTVEHFGSAFYPGIYAIWFAAARNRCLYIGKAKTTIHNRLWNHLNDASNGRLKQWIKAKPKGLQFSTLNLLDDAPQVISVIEDYLIWAFDAETNIQRKWRHIKKPNDWEK